MDKLAIKSLPVFCNDKVCYVHLAKTGGTFIRGYLSQTFNEFRRTELAPQVLWNDQRLLFSTIRNPLGFYVSWWSYNVRRRRIAYSKLLYGSFEESMKRVIQQKGGGADMQFKLGIELDVGPFTMRVLKTFFTDTLIERDREILFNLSSIDDLTQKDLRVKNIVKMEDLRDDLDCLLTNNIGIYSKKEREKLFSLPEANVGTYGCTEDHYTPELIDWVRHKDRLIFKLFGYA